MANSVNQALDRFKAGKATQADLDLLIDSAADLAEGKTRNGGRGRPTNADYLANEATDQDMSRIENVAGGGGVFGGEMPADANTFAELYESSVNAGLEWRGYEPVPQVKVTRWAKFMEKTWTKYIGFSFWLIDLAVATLLGLGPVFTILRKAAKAKREQKVDVGAHSKAT